VKDAGNIFKPWNISYRGIMQLWNDASSQLCSMSLVQEHPRAASNRGNTPGYVPTDPMATRAVFGRPGPHLLLLHQDDRDEKYNKLSRRKGARWRTRWGNIATVLVVIGSLFWLVRLIYSRGDGEDRYELDGLGLNAWRRDLGDCV
jgi:hypothetical protein